MTREDIVIDSYDPTEWGGHRQVSQTMWYCENCDNTLEIDLDDYDEGIHED